MSDFKRTFRLDRLYHQFLKPRGLCQADAHVLAHALTREGFIEMVDADRYSETEKLTSRMHRDELFRTVQGVVDALSNKP
jgi:hypothetical protein